jgi:hypothetical protein
MHVKTSSFRVKRKTGGPDKKVHPNVVWAAAVVINRASLLLDYLSIYFSYLPSYLTLEPQ